MELDEYSICIINPSDEKPHPCNSKEKSIQYQHGNVSYKKTNMSVAFVFRVVRQYCMYNTVDNTLKIPPSILSKIDKATITQCQFLYANFDKVKYNALLKELFHKTFS